MKLKILTGVILMLIISACMSEQQKLNEEITGVEKELKNDSTGVMNFQKAGDIVKLYQEYVKQYPDDSLSAKYLFRAADVTAHSHNTALAIELYKKVIEKYPQSQYVPQAWFYVGFLNDNELKNYPEARKAYTTLLQKYPDYDQRQSVEWLLENLGKSDLDIAKQFEANQNKTDSTTITETK
jgi:tetratricopeptide (TPR) repeat protein